MEKNKMKQNWNDGPDFVRIYYDIHGHPKFVCDKHLHKDIIKSPEDERLVLYLANQSDVGWKIQQPKDTIMTYGKAGLIEAIEKHHRNQDEVRAAINKEKKFKWKQS